jgi:hypothetical protein
VTPDFDEIVGAEGSPEELAELRQIHELLASASPPPAVAEPSRRRRMPSLRRSWAIPSLGLATVASVAATLVVALTVGHGENGREAFVRPMHGLGAASAAQALIHVGREDASGNRTLTMSVHSLPALAKGWYALYLTEKGKPAVACGVFLTGSSGAARVNMNAPADLGEYDGWIVESVVPGQRSQVLLAT